MDLARDEGGESQHRPPLAPPSLGGERSLGENKGRGGGVPAQRDDGVPAAAGGGCRAGVGGSVPV